jgi:hypothetical protein
VNRHKKPDPPVIHRVRPTSIVIYGCGDFGRSVAARLVRITVRCAFGNSDGMRSIRSCIYQYDLDLRTLIWTRGASFPLSNLATRLKCPSCGSRRVALVFTCRKSHKP